MAKTLTRCRWAEGVSLDYIRYHDEEWGVPLHDDRRLFEMLILEGAQAGLSWLTILKKRENFRAAYAGFSIGAVARFGEEDRARLDYYEIGFGYDVERVPTSAGPADVYVPGPELGVPGVPGAPALDRQHSGPAPAEDLALGRGAES